jgi:hypothetical protein
MEANVKLEMKRCEMANETATFYNGTGGEEFNYFSDFVKEKKWYSSHSVLSKIFDHFLFDFVPQIISIIAWWIIIASIFGLESLMIFFIPVPAVAVLLLAIHLFDVHM